MFSSRPVLAVAFVLLWNSGFIGAAVALLHAPTFTLLFWRYAALSLILGGAIGLTGRLRWPGGRRVGHALRVGILSHGVWLACVMLALDCGVPAGIVALVVALQPLVTRALSGHVTGEKTPAHRWFGLALGFIGVCVVLLNRIDFSDAGSLFGYLIPLVSVLAITVASLWQRRVELQEKELLLPADQSLLYQKTYCVPVNDRFNSRIMTILELSDDQVASLIRQLPPERRRSVLLALAANVREEREEWLRFGEERLRRLCDDRGLSWDSMSEDERERFIDDLLHED